MSNVYKRVEYHPAYSMGPFVLKGGWPPDFKRLPHQYVTWGPLYAPPLRKRLELISVQPGSKYNDYRMKDFTHYKVTSEYPTAPIIHGTWAYTAGLPFADTFPCEDSSVGWVNTTHGPIECPITGLPSVFDSSKVNVNDEWVPSVNGLVPLVAQLVKSAMPEIRPGLSSLNTLFELKDFRKLPSQIGKLKKTFSTLRKQVPRLFESSFTPTYRNVRKRNASKYSAASILGASSDVFLQQQFNISPLISDVKALFDQLRSVQKRVRKILDDADKRLVVHRSVQLDALFKDSFLESGTSVFWNGTTPSPRPFKIGAAKQSRYTKYTHRSLHVTLEYTYHIPELMRANAQLLGMLDSLGIQANPAIIWNALPWSFVVDWVLGVGPMLNRLSTSNLKPVTVIHEACWSLKVERELMSFINLGTTPGPRNKLASRVVETAYKRRVFTVGIETALLGSNISPKEFMLSSALAFSRLRR